MPLAAALRNASAASFGVAGLDDASVVSFGMAGFDDARAVSFGVTCCVDEGSVLFTPPPPVVTYLWRHADADREPWAFATFDQFQPFRETIFNSLASS